MHIHNEFILVINMALFKRRIKMRKIFLIMILSIFVLFLSKIAFSAFVVNSDGTVTDTETSLMWQQETAGGRDWEASLNYCESLNLAGYDDWRLPNRNELQSIVDYTNYNPAIDDTTAFPDTQSSNYWSSTTYAADNVIAWHVNFYNRYVGVGDSVKTSPFYVRAVRSGHGPLDYSDISVSPGTYDLGNVNVGSASSAQSLTITNNGTKDLVISSMVLTGEDSSMFDLIAGTCPNLTPTIAQGGISCAVLVTFSPTSEGIKSATLEITSDDPDTPILNVSLSGTGIVPLCGDVDKNGVVDIFDALKIAEYDAGLIPDVCE